MAQMNGLFRLGRDAELRYTPGNDSVPVVNMALAYNYGRKDAEGNRPTQWVDATLWGKLAEALAQYLVKGTQVYAVLTDVHIETYTKTGGGEGVRLAGRVNDIELAGGRLESAQQQSQPRQQGASSSDYQKATGGGSQRQAPAQRQPQNFDDLDSDIPF